MRLLAYGVVAGLFSLGGLALADEELRVGSGAADDDEVADIPLTLSADDPVQGLVMVFEWDGADGEGVDLIPNDGKGRPLDGADLVVKRVEDSFMVFSVVMDTDGKDQERIPSGDNTSIGTAQIRCKGSETTLRLVDEKHAMVDGGPVLSNLISIAGRSIRKDDGLELRNGTLSCEEEVEEGDVTFTCGGSLSGGRPREIKASPGSTKTVNFYYKDPGRGDGPRDRIQGLSMAVMYHCDLAADEDTLDDDGGALEDVRAEFVHIEVDNQNKSSDDDGCEFTLGVLIDAKSPFDGRTLPASNDFSKLFSLDFEVEDDADCGECLWIKFRDGLNGNGEVPVKNLVAINFQSERPDLVNCSICVENDEKRFVRGNCNFSDGQSPVDISDASAMVGHIFLDGEWKFRAPCKDACDANDDGRLDAGDIVFILNYLFVPGKPRPPSPGPLTPGSDPTNDNLDCSGATGDDC